MFTIKMCLALMAKFASPEAVPASLLCPAILDSAKEHSVDPYLVTRIMLHESKGVEYAYNSKTQDYGLMQVHLATARHYGFTETCLQDWRCNLDVGVYILAEMLHGKHARACSYNVGSHFETKMKSCLTYEASLANIEL